MATWKMVLATPMGPQEMVGHFSTQGDVLTGTLESPQGSQDFEGTVDGNQLKWDMKVTKPMPMTLKYDLTMSKAMRSPARPSWACSERPR